MIKYNSYQNTVEHRGQHVEDEILTLKEAAAFLKMAKVTLYRRLRAGEIPAVKTGRLWRLSKAALSQWAGQTNTTKK